MQRLLSLLPVLATRFFHSRRDLLLENLALRQQLAVLKVRQPRFAASDKLFWVMLCGLWPGWKQALILVQPETVVGWHRAGFKLYWKWLSRHCTRAGEKVCKQRIVRTHLPHGGREPDLGRAAYSWRTEKARLRHIGANGVALDAEGSEES